MLAKQTFDVEPVTAGQVPGSDFITFSVLVWYWISLIALAHAISLANQQIAKTTVTKKSLKLKKMYLNEESYHQNGKFSCINP